MTRLFVAIGLLLVLALAPSAFRWASGQDTPPRKAMSVHAPFDGVVKAFHAKPGQVVRKGQQVATLTSILRLTHKEGVLTGTMQGINNDQLSKIEGKVNGHEITFTRDNGQEYRGGLFFDDPTGKTNRLTMAGIFQAGAIQAGWYAKR